MKKKLFVLFLIIAVVLVSLYFYVYKDHRDIATETADFTSTTASILNDYKADEIKANAKYSDKIIVVKGKISEIDLATNSIVLDGKLYGMMSTDDKNLKVDDSVSVKGRFLGYDELLEEMKMDQITINK